MEQSKLRSSELAVQVAHVYKIRDLQFTVRCVSVVKIVTSNIRDVYDDLLALSVIMIAARQLMKANGIRPPPQVILLGRSSQHNYATQTSTGNQKPSRRAITVTSDDGRYHWSELSTGEKAARTTQQSFNFVFVTAGAVGVVSHTIIRGYSSKLTPIGLCFIPPIPRTVCCRFEDPSV